MNRLARMVVWPFVTLGLVAGRLGKAIGLPRLQAMARSERLRRELLSSGARVKLGKRLHVGRRVAVKVGRGATVEFGDGVTIGDDAFIRVFPGATLILGKGVHINTHTRVSAFVHIELGDESGLAAFSGIHDHHHKYNLESPWDENEFEGAAIKIGKGVAILARVAITEGVTIGDYSVVGANSVVTRDLPGGALCAGAPARVIRRLEGS